MLQNLSLFAVFACLCLLPLSSRGQADAAYAKTIRKHRKHYKQEFLEDERAPLNRKGVKKLRFYAPDTSYRVTATFERTTDAESFDMPTYSGITKPYVKFGTATFQLKDTTLQLAVYQSLRLIRMPQYRDYLFIPFKDDTNSVETYGGGRYMDITKSAIQDGRLTIDFNKAYNPWCAYSDGYNCPIPPLENHLPVLIEAGELDYQKR
ncbi:MAG: DUF1684 domain-containing protein [Phaeodactylibacter sp.]|uniref:DUF1684 domain-containing protein n=1 Tax=Phaeodactylibacter sp. TaxID=1940289 RepID=UPI0032EB73DF